MSYGPVFDNSLRWLSAEDAAAFCHWLGIEVSGAPVLVSESLAAATRYPDLVAWAGPGRLEHVEFVRTLKADLVLRMFEYHARLRQRRGVRQVRHHIVVLAGGVVDHVLRDGDATLDVQVHYMRDEDVGILLQVPGLAPLAVLGRHPDNDARARALRSALEVIATAEADPVRRDGLAEQAAVLAGLYLPRSTIGQALQEVTVPITIEDFLDSSVVQPVVQRARRQGLEEGRQQGLEEGREEERRAVIAALLRQRFGDDDRVPAVAARLAPQDVDAALRVVMSAKALDELASHS